MDTWMFPLFAMAASDDRTEAADMAEAMLFSSRRVPEAGRMVFAVTRAQEQQDDSRARDLAADELAEELVRVLVDKQGVADQLTCKR